ncbi:MAG: hypothetical protein KF690_11455 [Bacteroidetes bacterium]|nr:hypothetical protein [Bacteroidota bacterium]
MAKLELQPNEKLIDSWTVNVIINGSRFTGKVYITNQQVLMDKAWAVHFNALGVLQVPGNQLIAIPKSEIRETRTKTSFFNKRVYLTLNNGNELVIDRGMLSITPIVEALKA